MSKFKLDERLHRDTIYLGENSLNLVLLMNDQRWPWVIVVPKIAGISEMFQLSDAQRGQLDDEINQISQLLSTHLSCEKINIGALGNIVRQLHVHIIVRNVDDANWPGPVWGYGTREPYEPAQSKKFSTILAPMLKAVK